MNTLYLHNEPVLGGRIDDGLFACNWEWWAQCQMLIQRPLSPTANALDADILAHVIDSKSDTLEWQLHLDYWGDDGTICAEFLAFLRAGAFSVVDLRKNEFQN